MKKKIRKAVTHDGKFHTDDVFSAGILKTLYKDVQITRTRDELMFNNADVVFDIGMVYDPYRNRFDHHQKDSPIREGARGIPYSTTGLIWKHFGKETIKEVLSYTSVDEKEINYVWGIIDEEIIQPIDIYDNGMDFYPGASLKFQKFISSFLPSWNISAGQEDMRFEQAMTICKIFLQNEISRSLSLYKAREVVEEAMSGAGGVPIIEIDVRIPWIRALFDIEEEKPELKGKAKFVVLPGDGDLWQISSIPANPNSNIAYRMKIPSSWNCEDLVTEGVKFIHKKRHFCTVATKKAAIKLAEKAINKEE